MLTAAAAEFQHGHELSADESRTPLPLRSDTFLGVCEALGEDLGVNPLFIRIPFAALLLWNPVVVVAVYLGLGAVVMGSRWWFPISKPAAATSADAAHQQASFDDLEEEEERLAA
jgi:phage shock protein PspC (stress-responsive transcriptional regulator)